MRKYLLEHFEESSIFIFFFAKVDSQQHYLFGSDSCDDYEDDGDGDIFDNDADDKNIIIAIIVRIMIINNIIIMIIIITMIVMMIIIIIQVICNIIGHLGQRLRQNG